MSGKVSENGWRRVSVLRNLEISPRVYLISWPRTDDFIPGQVVQLKLKEEDTPRIYSVCSGSEEPEMSLLFNVKEDGSLTPRLASLVSGDSLFVSRPYGTFTGDDSPAWWIATGTGIAPFYSMFKSVDSSNVTLIHGARYLNQFYFEEELAKAMGDRYIRCCSGEDDGKVFPGRLTSYLEKVEKFPAGVRFFLCGNPLMVVEARDILIAKGVLWSDIVAEIYF